MRHDEAVWFLVVDVEPVNWFQGRIKGGTGGPGPRAPHIKGPPHKKEEKRGERKGRKKGKEREKKRKKGKRKEKKREKGKRKKKEKKEKGEEKK